METCKRKNWLHLVAACIGAVATTLGMGAAYAVHDTGFYDMDPAQTAGADTDDPTALTAKDGDPTPRADADTVFHEECNAIAVVPPANGDGAIVSACSPPSLTSGPNGFMGNDPLKDSDSGAFDQAFIVDSKEPDVSHHEPSNKDDQPLNLWGCSLKQNVNDKNDLLQGFVSFYQVPATDTDVTLGDILVFAGGVRDSNEGNENLGVWFYKDPNVNCTSTSQGGTGEFTGVHTDGDLLLVSEFENGGLNAVLKAFEWDDPTPATPEDGDESLVQKFSSSECADASGSPGNTHPANAPGSNVKTLCGMVNNTSIFPAWVPSTKGAGGGGPKPAVGELQQNLWGEIAANLTQTTGLGANTCFSKVLIETRTSSALDSNLFDYMLASVSVCGGLTIRKQTVGGFGGFAFSSTGLPANSGGSGIPDASGNFTLTTSSANNPVGNTFSNLLAGNKTIGETIPSGWQLTSVTCTGDTDGGSTFNGSPLPFSGTIGPGGANSLVVDLDIGETITCTFTDEALADLTLVKDVVNACAVDAGSFTLTIGGPTCQSGNNSVTGTEAAEPITTGQCVTPTGTRAVSEAVSGMVTLADYVTSVTTTGGNDSDDCQDDGTPVTSDSVILSAGESVTCTYTNVRKPTVTVIKQLTGGTSVFDLLVDGVVRSTPASGVGDGGTTGAVVISTVLGTNTFGPVTVSERLGDDTPVLPASFHTFWSCDDTSGTTPTSGTGTSIQIPALQAGENVTCTVTNIPIAAAACPATP